MTGPAARLEEHFERTMRLLDLMDAEPDIELRYGFHRILALVSGRDSARVDDVIRRLGTPRRRPRPPRHLGLLPGPELPAAALPGRLRPGRRGRDRPHDDDRSEKGRRALCASGGGITGLYFEMGALKCLADCLPPGALNAFDMYFGISAGAVLTGMLANGYSVDEFMAGDRRARRASGSRRSTSRS